MFELSCDELNFIMQLFENFIKKTKETSKYFTKIQEFLK